MKKLTTLFLSSVYCTLSFAQLNNTINYTPEKKDTWTKIKEKTRVGYFLNLSGPTLGGKSNSQTFSRFNSGKDEYGFDRDANDNLSYFHSLSLSYQALDNMSVGYSKAFVKNLTEGATYNWKSKNIDGSYSENESEVGTGEFQLNDRINFFFSNIVQGKNYNIGLGLSYEFASNEISRENGMQFGLVLSPSINFNTSVPGLYYGVVTKLQRDFYDQNKKVSKSCENCTPTVTEYRTVTTSIGPYISYFLDDKWSLRGSMDFDWDQSGDQTGTTEFGENMNDIMQAGVGYRINSKINTSGYLESVVGNTRMDNTKVGLTLGISI
jgi:hypothetical protein